MSSLSVQKKAAGTAPVELCRCRPAADLSAQYVDVKCEPKPGVASAGDEALGIEADRLLLGAAGCPVAEAGLWVLRSPLGGDGPRCHLPCPRARCCFSAYIQTLHANDHLLRAVMQMCSHQRSEKSAVAPASLLV